MDNSTVAVDDGTSAIVKPIPPDLFVTDENTAEMRWDALRNTGPYVPNDRFFVRNHTSTPTINARTWRLRLFGDGLAATGELTYDEIRAMPAVTRDVLIECAGNGRRFFASQQGHVTPGIAWGLGGVGVARWRGVPLAAVLDRAGVLPDAACVMARGLDPEYVEEGRNLGRVRRPLPINKARDDVLLAYEMNGETLPPDHGFPVRLVVPGWVGVASIKWVGDIEVSRTPLTSPWNTEFYRYYAPGQPEEGLPLTSQVVKSAFELPWDAELAGGKRHVLRGRSWSGRGRIKRVEVSVDGGETWRAARPRGAQCEWMCWQYAWRPMRSGPHVLMARATDETGASQPDRSPLNELGYLYGAVVRHPVNVSAG